MMTDKELLEMLLSHLCDTGAVNVAFGGGKIDSARNLQLKKEYYRRAEEKARDRTLS